VKGKSTLEIRKNARERIVRTKLHLPLEKGIGDPLEWTTVRQRRGAVRENTARDRRKGRRVGLDIYGGETLATP